MKEILEALFENQYLSYEEAKGVLEEIASKKYNDNQVASFLTVFRMRDLQVEELEGFRDAMIDLSKQVDLSEYDPLDIVGTGGDNKNTFNISTLSAIVVAGCGVNVAKHGNYSSSSVCGSSNVLEALGVKFAADLEGLKKSLDKAGICFLHAPLFHPAMKNLSGVRRELGFRTFFNILGPLVNPARPKRQLLGVSNLKLARLYSYLMQKGTNNYAIVHSLDGYDEISLTGPFKVLQNSKEQAFEPEELGFSKVAPQELYGGDSIKSATKLFKELLDGKGSVAQKEVVVANAGVALHCAKPDLRLEACFDQVRESLESGAAKALLQKLVE